MSGIKFDSDKPRWDLLPFGALDEIAKVLTFGAKKYADDNWQKVPNLRRRYFAAALRHLRAWRKGETKDSETGLPHLAHAACCLLFLLSEETGVDSDFGKAEPLSPNNWLQWGVRVRVKAGATYAGQTGMVNGVNIDRAYPFNVQLDDGALWQFCAQELEPALESGAV